MSANLKLSAGAACLKWNRVGEVRRRGSEAPAIPRVELDGLLAVIWARRRTSVAKEHGIIVAEVSILHSRGYALIDIDPGQVQSVDSLSAKYLVEMGAVKPAHPHFLDADIFVSHHCF